MTFNMENMELIVVNPDQLKKIVREAVKEGRNNPNTEIEFGERLTRREAAKFLDVSYQTMYNYAKTGDLKPRGHGRKQFYLKTDLIDFFNKHLNE